MNMMMKNMNLNGNSNMNFNMNNIEEHYITITFRDIYNEYSMNIQASLEEKVRDVINKFRAKANKKSDSLKFYFRAKRLNESLTLAEAGIENSSVIFVLNKKNVQGGGGCDISKEINIKFIKLSQNIINNGSNPEIIGLLKLCLLKEVSQKYKIIILY